MRMFRFLTLLLFGVLLLGTPQSAPADMIEAQRQLAEQGLYSGPVNGVATEETVKAIRRYQIRNGLPVTGALDAETAKSLSIEPPNDLSPVIIEEDQQFLRQDENTMPPPDPNGSRPGDFSDLRIIDFDEQPAQANPTPAPARGSNKKPARTTSSSRPSLFGDLFAGGPYANVSADIQRQIIRDAQRVLKQEGYYGGEIDGIAGTGTRGAIQHWQRNTGLEPNGRLDGPTLAQLGLAGNEPNRAPPSGPSVAKNGPPLPDQVVVYDGVPVGGIAPAAVTSFGFYVGPRAYCGPRRVYAPRGGVVVRTPRFRFRARW